MKSKYLLFLLSSLICLVTSGCVTKALVESEFYSGKYQETVKSILVTEDGNKLVLLGENYHYVFHADSIMVKALKSSCSPLISIYFSDMRVKTDNKLTTNFTLALAAAATDEQKKRAVELGFASDGKKLFMEKSGTLEGVRYSAAGFAEPTTSYRSTGPYYLSIVEEDAELNVAGKILLTPVAVLADGAIGIGGAALVLLLGGGAGVQ